jgi:leucyl aminopeptidase
MKIRYTEKPKSTLTVRFIPENEPIDLPDFTGAIDQMSTRYDNGQGILFCGIGPRESCTPAIIRTSAAKAVQAVQKLKRKDIAFTVPTPENGSTTFEAAMIEGILLGAYRYSEYKSEKPVEIATVDILGGTLSPADVRRLQCISESVNYARNLVNENASVITPAYLAKEAGKLATSKQCTVTVLDAAELRRKKLNLITAVGGGSATPPVLIMIEYRGGPRKSPVTALVGKGVTFDSGGQNLKPTGSIETMREDMAGAAAVLAVLSAATRLKAPVNLVGVVPAVHNAIGSRAFFPGDVYTSYAGKTVEIWSTDAEGRLILADAVAYCRDTFKPARIIDLATLTGGIITALGEQIAGLFANNDELAAALFNAGEETGERLWRLPVYKEYSDSLKGDRGDLRNLSKFKKGCASSITAAAFIQEFVGDTEWAHLDIAGTAYNEAGARGEIAQFASGFGVRLLTSYLGF